MIGNNVPLAMEPWEVIHSREGGPYATRTMLGWVINGPVRHDARSSVKANRVQVEEEGLSELINKLYNTEFSEKLSEVSKGSSDEDRKWCHEVEKSVKYTDGHYEIGLPLKKNEIRMPNNRNILAEAFQSPKEAEREHRVQGALRRIHEEPLRRRLC